MLNDQSVINKFEVRTKLKKKNYHKLKCKSLIIEKIWVLNILKLNKEKITPHIPKLCWSLQIGTWIFGHLYS